MQIRLGPQDKGAFEPNAKVRCDYVEGQLEGATPKFDCRLDDGSVVKVKYGLRGEVEGEVLATRLLWVLGFGADRMYPAVVTCRGCAADPWTTRQRVAETHTFDPAVIERKASGHAIATQKIKGWAWPELNKVDRTLGGAPIEQREKRCNRWRSSFSIATASRSSSGSHVSLTTPSTTKAIAPANARGHSCC
jgi:hypothetical protein